MQSPQQTMRRCGARTRTGTPCPTLAMVNGRCRMHGGLSTGPSKGRQNALRHGRFTAAAKERRRGIQVLLRRMRALTAALDAAHD
jgi:hypothetical protein